MAEFVDKLGAKWSIYIDVNTIRRVRRLAGFDLAKLFTEEGLRDIGSDPVLLVDVLYAVCQPSASQRGITDEQFGERLTGEHIDAASMALLEGVSDFLPPARRAATRRLIERGLAMQAELNRKFSAAIDGVLQVPASGGESSQN